MDTVKRALKFIQRNLLKNTRFFLMYALHWFDPDYSFTPRFFTADELLEQLDSGKSLIRYGDRETYLMNYGSDARMRTL